MSGKIKSTLELAMEKAAKLPRLTREEIRRRQKRSALRKLRGKVRFDLDLEETRR